MSLEDEQLVPSGAEPPRAIKKRETLEERLARIREAAEQAHSLEELCQKTGYQPRTLRDYTEKCNIPLLFPQKEFLAATPTARRPEIDRLVEQGKTLEEMGEDEMVKLSRERIRQYLHQTGQHDYWKQKRTEAKQAQPESRSRFCSLLQARARQSAEQRGWAYQKAYEYRSSLRQRRPSERMIPFESLLTLFQRYEKAKEQGEKRSLEELAKGLFETSEAGRILHRVGLEPMYWTCDRHITPLEKKLAINRAARRLNKIPYADIAYFLAIPPSIVQEHPAMRARKRGRGSGAKRIPKIFSEGRGKVYFLLYRDASQIYEAKDAGLTTLETVEYVNKPPPAVEYALHHRQEIAPVIVRTLKVLYPKEKINRPYRGNKP